jgi:hypothetical protein
VPSPETISHEIAEEQSNEGVLGLMSCCQTDRRVVRKDIDLTIWNLPACCLAQPAEAGSFSAERSHDWTALLLSGPVPQGKFDPVTNASLIVDDSQILPDSNYADPEFSRDFSVLQSVRDQPYNSSLALAELRDAVQRPLLGWQFPPRWDDRKREPVKSWGGRVIAGLRSLIGVPKPPPTWLFG